MNKFFNYTVKNLNFYNQKTRKKKETKQKKENIYYFISLLISIFPFFLYYVNNHINLNFDSSGFLFLLPIFFVLFFTYFFKKKATDTLLFLFFTAISAIIIARILDDFISIHGLDNYHKNIIFFTILWLLLLLSLCSIYFIVLRKNVFPYSLFSIFLTFFLVTQTAQPFLRYFNIQPHNRARILYKKTPSYHFKNFPNVYHFLYDAYPSHHVIQKFDKYDNHLDKDLEKLGFITYPNAVSAYARTFPSMMSLWYMNYFDMSDFEPYTTNYIEQTFSFSEKNPVFKVFLDNGYFLRVVANYCSKHSKIICDNLWISSEPDIISFISFLQLYIPYFPSKVNDFKSFLRNYFSAPPVSSNSKNVQVPKPHFIYRHYQDLVYTSTTAEFIQKSQKVNENIIKKMQEILQKDPTAVLFITADHGNLLRKSRNNIPEDRSKDPEKAFGILMALKFPQNCKFAKQQTEIAIPNLYRLLFSCLSGESEPKALLPNISISKPSSGFLCCGFPMSMHQNLEITKKTYKLMENGKSLPKPIKIDKIPEIQNSLR